MRHPVTERVEELEQRQQGDAKQTKPKNINQMKTNRIPVYITENNSNTTWEEEYTHKVRHTAPKAANEDRPASRYASSNHPHKGGEGPMAKIKTRHITKSIIIRPRGVGGKHGPKNAREPRP